MLEAHEAYGRVTKWISGNGIDMINQQNCFAANFGFKGEIPIPEISFSVDDKPNLSQYELDRYYSCFFVFIGGKYVDVINDVMKVAGEISKIINKPGPVAVFIMTDYTKSLIMKNLFVSVDNENNDI